MPLTPADVDSVEFPAPPSGSRGYDESEVDAFLDVVADELRRLAAENQALSRRAGRMERGDNTELAAERAALTERLQRLRESCARAERDARAMRAKLEQARTAGADASPSAQPGIAGVIELAQRTADEHIAEAQQEADAVLRQATTKAAQLTSDAELRASTLIADARHDHAERVAGIAEKRAAALEEISELTHFAERYREGLNGLLNDRLAELTGKPRSDKPGSQTPTARSA